MEVFVADCDVQFIINDRNGDNRILYQIGMFIVDYIKTVYSTCKSLLSGMRLTGYYFFHHKEIITEQYPLLQVVYTNIYVVQKVRVLPVFPIFLLLHGMQIQPARSFLYLVHQVPD